MWWISISPARQTVLQTSCYNPPPVWGTENEEVACAIYKVCVRWSGTSLNMRCGFRGRGMKNFDMLQNCFLKTFRCRWRFRFSFWLQLHVAAVHILHFYEEWTTALLLLSSERASDSSMDTDWVSRRADLSFPPTGFHHVVAKKLSDGPLFGGPG